MATAARVVASPRKTRKGRTVPAVQPSTNFFSSNADEDNLTARRVQRLVHGCGISEHRARLVADLAWETAHV